MKKIILITLFLFFKNFIYSQEKNTFNISYEDIPLKIVIDDIEYRFQVDFIYTKDVIKDIKINLPLKKRNLQVVLNDITKNSNLKFTRIDNTHFYISKTNIVLIQNDIVSNFLTKGIHQNLDGSYAINPNKIGILPGLIEPDVLESLQQFPNVLSINETATEINIRGGRTDQNNVIWDDINMYLTGHLFGMVSAFNPYVAENVNFYDKATNAKYDEKISSITDIKTNDNITDKTKLQLGVSAISTDAILNLPLIAKKMDLQLSFRHSFEHLFETPTFKKYENKAFQNTTIKNEDFNFNDYNAKLNFVINDKNSIHFSYIHMDNDLENERRNPTNTYKDVLDMENTGYSSKWLKSWSNSFKQNTGFSISKYGLYYNLETINSSNSSSFLEKTNNINDLKIFTDFNINLKKGGLLNFGYQFKKQDVNLKVESFKNITYILDKNNASIKTHSLYSGATFQKTLNYFIYVGLRANYYDEFNKTKFTPRFMVNKNLNQFFKIQLTGEIKNQIISQVDETLLGNYSINNKLWRLSDDNTFPILESKHISTEFAYERDKWTIETSVYYKDINGITSLSLGYLNPNDNSFHSGKEIIKGASIHIDRDFGKINTWINYSFSDVKNRFDGILNNTYFTADTQIKHAFNSAISYKNKGLQMAINWKYRTGKPVTVISYDSNNNAYIDKINSETLPDFHRMDFSCTYKFLFKKKGNTKGQLGFSIRNVYDNKNIIARVYTGNNSINDPFTYSDYESIGITPNFMFRVFF